MRVVAGWRKRAQAIAPIVALLGALVAVPLSSAVHGSPGLWLPAPRYLSSNIDDYVALHGDQVVVVPDGSYTAGALVAPHPATSGPYGGTLVLVAQDEGQVVVDPGFGNRLWLQAGTSGIVFVGFSFRGEVVDDGAGVTFWYCDHQDPDYGYLQRPGNHVPSMFTASSGPLALYGDDFHNGVATPVVLGAVKGVTVQGARIFGLDGRFDGWSGAPGTDSRSHLQTIAATGGLSDLQVLDTYLEGSYSIWDTTTGSDWNLSWHDIWYAFGYQNPFQLGARNGNTVRGARRAAWQIFGGGADATSDPLIYVGTTAYTGAQEAAQQAGVQLSDAAIAYGHPAGVTSATSAEAAPSNPANAWRTAHAYDSWPGFFGWPPPSAATTTETVPPSTFTPASNIAAFAMVTASSESFSTGQVAAKAVDGSSQGWPVDYTHEWATVGGGAGSWLQLAWAAPAALDHLVLYDRPNGDDQVTGAILAFSDGSTVAVPALPNNGAPATVMFPVHATTSVRVTITSVSPTTLNIGLAEIEAWTAPAPAVTTTTTTTIATTTIATPSPTPTLNTLDKVVAYGEPTTIVLPAPESGWPGWTSASNNPLPNPLGRWPDTTAWFQAFPDPTAAFPAPGSVLVEVKDIEMYVHSQSQSLWLRVQAAVGVDGYWYSDDWQTATHASWQQQVDGGLAAAIPNANEFIHGWPTGARGVLPVPDSDVDGEYVTAQARLVGPGASTARVLFNLGADWWINSTAPSNGDNGPTGNNEQVLSGPMVHLTDRWDAYSAWPSTALAQLSGSGSWTAARMRASAPPLDAMGLP